MHWSHFYFYRLGRNFFQVVFHQTADFLMILIGHQAATDLGVCLGRKYRFAPLSGISTPNATDVEGRTATVTLQSAVTGFTLKFVHSNGSLIGGLIKRNVGNHVALSFGHRQHIIVEMRYGNAAFFVHYLGQYLAQGIDGIGYGPTKVS